MTRLEGVEITSGDYGTKSTIDSAEINNCVVSGASIIGGTLMDTTISNPMVLSFDENSIISVGNETFTGKELLDAVKAIEKLREVYPEHFI